MADDEEMAHDEREALADPVGAATYLRVERAFRDDLAVADAADPLYDVVRRAATTAAQFAHDHRVEQLRRLRDLHAAEEPMGDDAALGGIIRSAHALGFDL